MARPSKLTDKQWSEVEKRLLNKEKPATLAKEFGIDRAAITRRFSQQLRNVESVAKQLVEADSALKLLPVAQQVAAISLADELKAISSHLASAAKFGSMTAHRLAAIAHKQTDLIDETAGIDANANALKSVMAMTKGANDASQIGINLLAANKEFIKDANTGVGEAKSDLLKSLVEHLPD